MIDALINRAQQMRPAGPAFGSAPQLDQSKKRAGKSQKNENSFYSDKVFYIRLFSRESRNDRVFNVYSDTRFVITSQPNSHLPRPHAVVSLVQNQRRVYENIHRCVANDALNPTRIRFRSSGAHARKGFDRSRCEILLNESKKVCKRLLAYQVNRTKKWRCCSLRWFWIFGRNEGRVFFLANLRVGIPK